MSVVNLNTAKCRNIQLPANDYNKLSEWCIEEDIDLVVVGPEYSLANGIVDFLSSKGKGWTYTIVFVTNKFFSCVRVLIFLLLSEKH